MKSKKLLTALCLFALTGCEFAIPTSSSVAPSSSSSAVSNNESSNTNSESSNTNSESSDSAPVVEYAKIADFRNYNASFKLMNAGVNSTFVVGEATTIRFDVSEAWMSPYAIDDGEYSVIINGETLALSYDAEDVSPFGYLNACYTEYTPTTTDDLYIYACGTINYSNDNGYTVSHFAGENYTLIGHEDGAKYSTFYFAIANKIGYKVKEVYYVVEGTTDKIPVTPMRADLYMIDLEANIALYVEMEVAEIYNIKFINADNLDFDRSTYVTAVTEGNPVTLDLYAKSGYYIADITLDEASMNDNIFASDYMTFTMPGHDVELTFDIRENLAINVVENDKILSYAFYDDYSCTNEVTGFMPYGSFYIKVTAVEGYAVSGVSIVDDITGKECSSYYSGGAFSVYGLGENPVTVSFNVVEASEVKLTTVGNGIAMFDNGESTGYFLPDDYVTFTVVPEEGYKVKSITCSNEDIHVNEGGSNTYWFYMAEGSAELTIEFEKITYATVTLGGLVGDLTSVEVEGYSSGTYVTAGESSSNFQIGEEFGVYFFASSNKYEYSIVVTDDFGSETYYLGDSTSGGYYLGIVINSSNTSIEILAEAKTPVTYEISVQAGIEVQWYLNDEAVDTLGDVYTNDTVALEINTPAAEGTKYVVTFNGEARSYYRWDIEDNFSINVSSVEVSLAPWEIINESSCPTYSAYWSFCYYPSWEDVSEDGIEIGNTIYIEINPYAGVIIEVYVGDTLVTTLTKTYGQDTYKLDITDNSKVTLIIKDAA